MAEEKLIGKISHFFGNISVGIIELTDVLAAGEKIHIKGSSTDFEQTVDSMQIEHQNVDSAKSGDAIGIKVAQKVKENDQVYKVLE
jgi:putative protease